jgi:hypothetical protein
MKNLAHRHRRAARKMGAAAPVLTAYVICDPDHRPDLRGEFAGTKVVRMGSQQVVYLSASAARFYLDSGSIEPLVKEEAKQEVAVSDGPVE